MVCFQCYRNEYFFKNWVRRSLQLRCKFCKFLHSFFNDDSMFDWRQMEWSHARNGWRCRNDKYFLLAFVHPNLLFRPHKCFYCRHRKKLRWESRKHWLKWCPFNKEEGSQSLCGHVGKVQPRRRRTYENYEATRVPEGPADSPRI